MSATSWKQRNKPRRLPRLHRNPQNTVFVILLFRKNTYAAPLIELSLDQKVISTGPYAVVRHPMYSSALIWFLGVPLALGSAWGVLLLIPMTLVFIWRLLGEEKFLSANLPGYTEYKNKVRYRLVPWLW
jgi:protein-S-isoprenylcysteine O-methyltransferase Ste14